MADAVKPGQKQCSVIIKGSRQCKHPAVMGDRCLIHQKDHTHKSIVRRGFWFEGRYYRYPDRTIDEVVAENDAQKQPIKCKDGERMADGGST